jgi:hypothetical protein
MTSHDMKLAAQKAAVAELEERLWQHGFDESRLADYQAAFRRLEQLIDEAGADARHKFVIVIPVADRPQHLRSCLDSVLELCRTFGYGGIEDGRYRKVEVIIADDSRDAAHIASNKQLAAEFTALGVATRHFGQDEQFDLVQSVRGSDPAALQRVLGQAPREAFGHKGQGVMRNIAYLKLRRTATAGERVLFYSIDSDQEFKVKLPAAGGDREVCAVNFFYRLDEIFAATDALVLTGKVVGDPPVSPAVMIGNFLEDVTGFLHRMAASEAGGGVPCRQHRETAHTDGDAAYHDMADLFGFGTAGAAYSYRCPLVGEHTDADCFEHFAARLNSFFYGEHPTRLSFYAHAGAGHAVVPARTVYAGNYVFRAEALEYFIPFAALRLRMSGPTLGRLIRAELGTRFVSANLPMLHKRTVETTGQSEFRPGISTAARAIDLSGEFERQFYGDVMLFSIERLTASGFPAQSATSAQVGEIMGAVRAEMLQRYNAKRVVIGEKLRQLTGMIAAPTGWWNASPRHAAAREAFASFAANVARNFGDAALAYERINSAEGWARWRAELIDAVVGYPDDRHAWRRALGLAAGA